MPQQITITLPDDVADYVRGRVADGAVRARSSCDPIVETRYRRR